MVFLNSDPPPEKVVQLRCFANQIRYFQHQIGAQNRTGRVPKKQDPIRIRNKMCETQKTDLCIFSQFFLIFVEKIREKMFIYWPKKKHVFLWLTHVQIPYGLKFSQFLNRGPYGSQETHLAPETEKSEKIRILTAIIRNWFDVLRMNSDNFGAPLYLRYGLRNFKKTGFVLKVRYSEKSIARVLYRKFATQDIKIS